MNIVDHAEVTYIRVEVEESRGPIHLLVEPCFWACQDWTQA